MQISGTSEAVNMIFCVFVYALMCVFSGNGGKQSKHETAFTT